MNNVNKRIDVQFEKLSEYNVGDTRFTLVKVWLMHLGLNLNNSIFNKEPVEKAIPSLANTPILAYIERNDNGDEDFSDHREGLEIEKGKIKVKYKGSAYGVIPESNEAKFEKKICADGIEREFLTCKGLIWNKFSDATDILSRDVYKDESMELSDSYTGSFNADGNFVFDTFYFDGACFLGNGVQPAMTGACIEINFAMNEIKAKLDQFNTYINNQPSNDVDNKEDFEKGGQETLELENNVEEVNENEIDEEGTVDVNKEILEPEQENTEETFSSNNETEITFSSTYVQKRKALDNALVGSVEKDENGDIISEISYWVVDFDDAYVYVEKYVWSKGDGESENGRFSYTFDEMSMEATISGEFEKMFVTWLTAEENEAIAVQREQYSVEIERLKKFEQDTLKEKRDIDVANIFSNFEDQLVDVPAYSELKKNCTDMSLEDIEDKCFALVGKLTSKFSAKTKKEKVVKLSYEVTDESSEDDDGYGGILASKYNK